MTTCEGKQGQNDIYKVIIIGLPKNITYCISFNSLLSWTRLNGFSSSMRHYITCCSCTVCNYWDTTSGYYFSYLFEFPVGQQVLLLFYSRICRKRRRLSCLEQNAKSKEIS